MSLLFPNSKNEVDWSGWVLCAFLLAPVLLYLGFLWRVYFSFEGHAGSAALALVLAIPGTILMHRRSVHLLSKGLHPYPGQYSAVKLYVLGYIGLFLILYGWSLTALALALPLAGRPLEAQTYIVDKANYCSRRRCHYCSFRISIAEWPGLHGADLCAENLTPRVRANDRVHLRGRYTTYAVYVGGMSIAERIM